MVEPPLCLHRCDNSTCFIEICNRIFCKFTQDCRSLTKSDIKSGGQLATTSKVLILVGPHAQTMFVHVWYPTSGHARSINKCSRTVWTNPWAKGIVIGKIWLDNKQLNGRVVGETGGGVRGWWVLHLRPWTRVGLDGCYELDPEGIQWVTKTCNK